MAVDEATTMKMHSKVRWGNVEEVEALLKIDGAANCQVRTPRRARRALTRGRSPCHSPPPSHTNRRHRPVHHCRPPAHTTATRGLILVHITATLPTQMNGWFPHGAGGHA